jgi:hypothetical protein
MRILNQSLIKNTRQLVGTHYSLLCALKNKSVEAMDVWLAHKETGIVHLLECYNNQGLTHAKAIALNPNATPELLANLVKNNAAQAFLEIAQHINTPLCALRVIATKDKRDNVLEALSRHVTMVHNGPYELKNSDNINVRRNIALTMLLSNEEIMTLWKMGGRVKLMLLQNPTLSSNVLSQLSKISSDKELVAIARNVSAPPELLTTLSKNNDALVKNAVALNPNCPVDILDKLASDHRGNSALSVARNHACPESILTSLSLNTLSTIREAVAKHSHTKAEVLDRLSQDSNEVVRREVALNPKTSLLTLKRLAGDGKAAVSSSVALSDSLGVVRSLNAYQKTLKEMGGAAFNFYHLESPKKVMKLLINSKHPLEVEFVFGAKHIGAINAISALQSGYTNHKFKLNRADYLMMISKINEVVIGDRRTGVDVDPVTLKKVFKYFGENLVVEVLSQYESDESKDTLRMLGTLVSFQTNRINREYQAEINTWLGQAESRRGDFHNYLTRKTRDIWLDAKVPFYQTNLIAHVSEASKLVDTGWVVNLPTNSKELLSIGDAQSHCVGGKYYADRCIDGSSIIFQIMPKDNVKHGFTFQYSRSGRLEQAKGFGNDAVPTHHIRDSKRVFDMLTKGPKVSEFEKNAA